MWRAVLDTNVLVSSLLVRRGHPAQVLAAWRARRFVLVTSQALIAEMRATLSYDRIRRKYHITDGDVQGLADLLGRDALVVPGTADVAGAVEADPDDEIVLACAADGFAHFVVSGDQHLLQLRSYQGIPILNPREFLDKLAAERDALDAPMPDPSPDT